jgi:hypothetical protein
LETCALAATSLIVAFPFMVLILCVGVPWVPGSVDVNDTVIDIII